MTQSQTTDSPPLYYNNRGQQYARTEMSPFGAYLQDILDQRKMTRASLSRDAGLNNSHVSILCNGYYHPSPMTAQRIANSLQIPFDELWEQVQDSRARWKRRHKVEGSKKGFMVKHNTYVDGEVDMWLREMAKPAPGRAGRPMSRLIHSILRRAMKESLGEAEGPEKLKGE